MDPQALMDGAGKALKTIPELYKDGLQPGVQETGKMLARIPKAINAALCGVDIWIAKKEYNVDETKKLLAHKLENVDPEKIVPPEPYVAVPAIEAISYSMDSKELREMYANLLAKSMIIDKKDKVLPSFVEIIKQMSPLDARILKTIVEARLRPMITIRLQIDDTPYGPGNDVFRHITWILYASIDDVNVSLDNLQRCGLIKLDDVMSYTDEISYSAVKQSPFYLSAIESCQNIPGRKAVERKGEIAITDLGRAFYSVCLE